ncbi:MAG: hypothetical protein ACJ74L_05895 [Gaiellaceae bacterium]
MRESIAKLPVEEYGAPPLTVTAPPLGALESATGSNVDEAERPALFTAPTDCAPLLLAVAV